MLVVYHVVSDTLELPTGVPHELILGSLWYIIYISLIVQCFRNCKHQGYADDTQVYFSFFHFETDENVQNLTKYSDLLYRTFLK